jgi:hypothetical protein
VKFTPWADVLVAAVVITIAARVERIEFERFIFLLLEVGNPGTPSLDERTGRVISLERTK